ncbi:MAG: AraC family transcriptional regulator [Bacteroidia bacterium]|nr:AraC family transcriptional regulator [Bacteroidia bacterium]
MNFPVFNIYGTSLLLLTLQGLVFCLLLFQRYRRQRNFADLLLTLILLITCYHQTTYTLGFMSWFDTYPTTKINYLTPDLSLALAPLIYFYIKSTTAPDFTSKDIRLWHFLPVAIYILIKVFILVYDAMQPGFSDVQNGPLVINFEWKYLSPFLFLLTALQMLLYLAFSYQVLYAFREKIKHYFANTYRLELNWLRNFLIAYSLLYLFNCIQSVIDAMIVDLSWRQEWWYYLLSGIAIIYVGMKGYFTGVKELGNADFVAFEVPKTTQLAKSDSRKASKDLDGKKTMIQEYFLENKPYLDKELSLITLARQMNLSREELSEVINQGFNTRFNDFINAYRISEIKSQIKAGKHQTLSLLGLAYEAGFNSKATFNRAFKKAEGQSPSAYLASLNQI